MNKTYPMGETKAPEVGIQFRDASFNTLLTQVTKRGKIRHEYARFDPFNSDQTMILLQDTDEGSFFVYKTHRFPYEDKTNKVTTVKLGEARWDPDNPDVLWGFDELKISKFNVRTKKTMVVKDFSKDSEIGPIIKKEPDLYKITMKDEGESSTDKRFWALALQGEKQDYRIRYIFCWDASQNKVLGIYQVPAGQADIDWVGMSKKGTYVVIGGLSGEGKHAGLTIADRELRQFHKLAQDTAHSDVGLDLNGNEVIVMQNSATDYIDLIPLDFKTKPVNGVDDYDGSKIKRLLRLYYDSGSDKGFNSGVHISCNAPGYCVVSTYTEPGVEDRNWLDRSLVIAKLDYDNPGVYYLAKIHNTTDEYWEETQATITDDGSRIVWASNWGQDVGEENVCLVQLDMPKNWPEKLK